MAGTSATSKMGCSHKVLGLGGGGVPESKAERKVEAESGDMSTMPLVRASKDGRERGAEVCSVLAGATVGGTGRSGATVGGTSEGEGAGVGPDLRGAVVGGTGSGVGAIRSGTG